MEQKKYSQDNAVTVIGVGTHIQGEVRCKGTIRVEGEVTGRVHGDDTIIIHETGKVKADLIATQIIIGGEVEGNVYAQERLEITAQGRLIGDVTAPRVSIAEGVIFEGKCAMRPPGEIPPSKYGIPGQKQEAPHKQQDTSHK